ncbi:MAG: methylated-DNA--[protein]-cysteine S-methyltransferase [Planctomycetaceae bacterium]|nr:methylated-DNA--[protein]-cysteine S-methyltransferase [Planctomycetaceae bacterium]
MALREEAWTAQAFETELGWMGIVGRHAAVRQLAIGAESPARALAALDHAAITAEGAALRIGRWNHELVARLQAFAAGKPDDFLDVEIELGDRSEFAQRVIDACRRIPWGATASYGELALRAGAPRAARAVGSVMASNRVALLIPCHRVVRGDGGIGGYTCPAGIELKRRILALEAAMRSGDQDERRPGKRQRQLTNC